MSSQHKVTSIERQQMIAEAAYFRAERRGFSSGDPIRDWCEAEAEVDARLHALEENQLVERLEQLLASAGKRLAAARRKVASMSSEARGAWQRDVDKLATLRDTLQPKLVELRAQGEQAGRKLREQAEGIRDEIADLLRRLEVKAKH